MESIHIHGGISLQGNVRIQGSKNAALPVLAATLLTKGTNIIHNCPRITDIYRMLDLLESLGCLVSWEGDGVRVDAAGAGIHKMPAKAITEMRSSICLLGALLGRSGHVAMEFPGGCCIGERPIDLHLEALAKLGASFTEEDGVITGDAGSGLRGTSIMMGKSSVGATENAVLAAVAASGETYLAGAAREPEIAALCGFLTACGADISGIGSGTLRIRGGRPLTGAEFTVPADRIVAGTYALACMGTGGSVFLERAPSAHMEAVIAFARRLGAVCQRSEEGLYLQMTGRPRNPEKLTTAVYPGFPTDLQSVALAVMTVGCGRCLVEETIFENRFRILDALSRMGARVERLSDRCVEVEGCTGLTGCEVEARELRGGAALVTAGVLARGETVVRGCGYIERGYENICRDFRELGARIYSA